jgi:hypothetical protein
MASGGYPGPYKKGYEITGIDEARKFIHGRVSRAIVAGYVNRRPDILRQQLEIARQAYDYYQREQGHKTHLASRDRMKLRPFGQMVADTLADMMTRPHGPPPRGIPFAWKMQIWSNMPMFEPGTDQPNELKQRVWDRIRRPLYAQVRWFNDQQRRAGQPADRALDPEQVFPEPPGMDAYRHSRGLVEPSAAPTGAN